MIERFLLVNYFLFDCLSKMPYDPFINPIIGHCMPYFISAKISQNTKSWRMNWEYFGEMGEAKK
jgi:hypothetical protein